VAARAGNEDCIRAIVEAGADVDSRSRSRCTALIIAAMDGLKTSVSALIECKADVDAVTSDSVSALYCAAQGGHCEVAALLIVGKANINLGHNDGRSPLYMAAQRSNNEMIATLLESDGIDVNKAQKDGRTPLYITAEKGNHQGVHMLISRKADVNLADSAGFTPLHRAVEFGGIETVVKILQDPDVDINKGRKDGVTPLYLALEKGDTKMVSKLLELDQIDINKSRTSQTTPLYIACQRGLAVEVHMLLSRPELDVNRTRQSYSPLLIACEKNHPQVVRHLLSHPAVQVNLASDEGTSPLLVAAHLGHGEILNLLMEREDINIHHEDSLAETALLKAATAGHIDMIQKLLKVDQNGVHHRNAIGRSCLHLSAENSEAFVILLRAAGISALFQEDNHGHDVLQHLIYIYGPESALLTQLQSEYPEIEWEHKLHKAGSAVSSVTRASDSKSFCQCRGGLGDVFIDTPASTVRFSKFSTVVCPATCVEGQRAYFEITLIEVDICPQYGFVTPTFQRIHQRDASDGVGDAPDSWAFDGVRKAKWCPKLPNNRGDYNVRELWKAGDVIGIAVDMENGVASCSINGDFDTSDDPTIELFGQDQQEGLGEAKAVRCVLPAITGSGGAVKYNLGAEPFAYSPPSADFLPFCELPHIEI